MKIENVDINLLAPYERNAKEHPQTQIENVAESIKQFGWQQPIVVDKDFIIIIGHCRYLAAKALGLEEVPVVVASDLTDEQVKKLRLVDNKTNESAWLDSFLKQELEDIDFSDFNFEWNLPDVEITEQDKEVVEDEFNPKEIEIKTQKGDLYKLGNHLLLCGDSTNKADIEKLIGGGTSLI